MAPMCSLLSSRGLDCHKRITKKEVSLVVFVVSDGIRADRLFHDSCGSNESNGEIIGYSGIFRTLAHTAKVASGCSVVITV